MKAPVSKSNFGSLPDGTPVDRYSLTNANGVTCRIITYGGIVTELHAPDKKGKPADVVLGFDDLASYLKGHPYFGAIVGRFANRIANGRFVLDGTNYTLAVNNGPNALHGGLKGFDKMVWKAESANVNDGVALKLTYASPDGEEGYPGNLEATVTYTLTGKSELRIDYEATTDKPTPINLTNHSYWNLAGEGDVLGHELMIRAQNFTPTDDNLIPTGEIASVKGTALDFTTAKPIGRDMGSLLDAPQRGYDHNFVLDGTGGELSLAARVREPGSGRVMEVFTTEPGAQLYTANFLDDTNGKGGRLYRRHGALCLETQHFPDSVNKPQFPSTILRPGQTYRQTTIHRFAAE